MSQPKNTDTPILPSAFQLFRPSWEALLVNWQTFLLLVLTPLAIIVLGAAILLAGHGSALQLPLGVIGAVAVAAGIVVALTVPPTQTYLQIKSARGVQVSYRETFENGLHYFWRIWGLSICVGAIVVIGLILFIVPGLFMLRRYILAPYFLIDRNMGVFEAMRTSTELSKKYGAAVWGLIGVQFLLVVPSFIPFIGSLITWILDILYYCAAAVRYEQIGLAEAAVSPKVKSGQTRSKKSS